MTSSTVDQRISDLGELIDSYESGKLKRDIASLKRQFRIEVFFAFVVPIIATILSAFLVNLTAMLAPIIIGAANIVDKVGLSKTMISSYFKDKDVLEGRPDDLRARVQIAKKQQDTHKQKEMLDDVEQKISSYYPLPQT